MTHARSDLVKAAALLSEAHDDITGALVLFNSNDQRRHHEYLRDAKRELECAVKAMGGRVVWEPPISSEDRDRFDRELIAGLAAERAEPTQPDKATVIVNAVREVLARDAVEIMRLRCAEAARIACITFPEADYHTHERARLHVAEAIQKLRFEETP